MQNNETESNNLYTDNNSNQNLNVQSNIQDNHQNQNPINQESQIPISPIQNSNNNINNVQQKKNNPKYIIVIVLIILIIITIILCYIKFVKSPSQQDKNSNNSKTTTNSEIKQIMADSDYIVMLDKNGNLYLHGELPYGINTNKTTKKIASDVKLFKEDGRAIILNNKNEALYTGLSIDGWGEVDEFKKITDNIKTIKGNEFCFYIIDNNDNYIVRGPIKNNDSMKFCALPSEYDGNFSKIAQDVKDIYSTTGYNGYLTKNGELYISDMNNPGYNMVMKDVDEIIDNSIIKSKDKLYYISTNGIEEYPDNISEFYEIGNIVYDCYKDKEENYYTKLFRNDYKESKKLDYKDINTPLYYTENTNRETYKTTVYFVYLNTNNKIILQKNKTKQELELNVNSMKQIYDFIQESKDD